MDSVLASEPKSQLIEKYGLERGENQGVHSLGPSTKHRATIDLPGDVRIFAEKCVQKYESDDNLPFRTQYHLAKVCYGRAVSPYVKKKHNRMFFRCLRYLKVISFLCARKHAVLCYTTILRVNSFLRYHLTVNLITCFTVTKHANTTTMTSDGNESNLKHYVHFLIISIIILFV
jgi:hypothetical protein